MSKTLQYKLLKKLDKLVKAIQKQHELVLELGSHVSLLRANVADGTGISSIGIAKMYEILGRLRTNIDNIEKICRELLTLYEQSLRSSSNASEVR